MLKDHIYKFTQGNPGCLTVVTQLTLGEVLKLESMGLLGSAVWIAYKDICGSDIVILSRSIDDGSIEAKVKATKDWKFEHGETK